MKIIKEVVNFIFPVVIVGSIVILLRTFVVTPVIVDGKSMDDTLHNGDLLLLDKMHYVFNDISRYDIVAIHYKDSNIIKRIVGMPGDTIKYENNKLYINSKEAIDIYNHGITSNFTEVYIPNNYYFVLGDNREHSFDSRDFGIIHKDDILGVVDFRLYPLDTFGKIK